MELTGFEPVTPSLRKLGSKPCDLISKWLSRVELFTVCGRVESAGVLRCAMVERWLAGLARPGLGVLGGCGRVVGLGRLRGQRAWRRVRWPG